MNVNLNSATRRRFSIYLCAAALALFLGGSALLSNASPRMARGGNNDAPRTARNGSNAVATGLAADKGKFKILVGGQEVGTEQFEITASGGGWLAKGTSEIKSAQGPAQHITGSLQLHADGVPNHYEWSTDGAKKASSAIGFANNIATIELKLEGMKPFTQTFTFTSPMVVVLDNNLYHQYVVLSHLYDWSKGGAQNFSVLVPQEMTPGTVTVDSLGSQAVGGAKQDELRVKTDDNELDLYLDSGKLVRIVAPAANAEIVRE
jgi:hypothetical protein